jgi:cold shock CspA family protein
VKYRKAKYNLEFKEAQEAIQRITEMLATLPSPELKDTSKNSEGVIESYNESRGFGFINSQSDRIFFHISSFASQRKIRPGLRVTFTSEYSPKGLRAVHVELAEEGLRLAS